MVTSTLGLKHTVNIIPTPLGNGALKRAALFHCVSYYNTFLQKFNTYSKIYMEIICNVS